MEFRLTRRSGAVVVIVLLLIIANLLLWDLLPGLGESRPAAPVAVKPTLPPLPEPDPQEQPLAVDALWQRYQAINGASTGSGIDSRAQARAQREAEIAALKEKREQARVRREERRARREAIGQALQSFNQTLARIDTSDSRQVLTAVEGLNRQLSRAGIENAIDIQRLRQLMAQNERFQKVAKALMAESAKGGDADSDRLSALSAELQKLQAEMPELVRQLTAGGVGRIHGDH